MKDLVICGSQRFKEELDVFVRFLEKRSVHLRYPDFRYHRKRYTQKPEHLRPRSPKIPGLVMAHLQKIREVARSGGVCLIFNPAAKEGQKKQYGYIGFNTCGEIFAAYILDMTVIMLCPSDEESIMALVPKNERKRIFTIQHPKAEPSDLDAVWEWLRRWLQ